MVCLFCSAIKLFLENIIANILQVEKNYHISAIINLFEKLIFHSKVINLSNSRGSFYQNYPINQFIFLLDINQKFSQGFSIYFDLYMMRLLNQTIRFRKLHRTQWHKWNWEKNLYEKYFLGKFWMLKVGWLKKISLIFL